MREVILIGAYTNTIEKELTLIKHILDWKKQNIPIILSTHYPVSEKVQNLVDYYIFDREQHLDPILINQHIWWNSSFKVVANYDRPYHAAAALIAHQNAIRAFGDKFEFVYFQEYDVDIDVPELVKFIRTFQFSPFKMFVFPWNNNPEEYATNVWFFKQRMFNQIWGDIQSVSDYMKLVKFANTNSTLIEPLMKNLIDIKNLNDEVYVFDELQTKKFIKSFNSHIADIIEPRIYLTRTSSNQAILFLVNESQKIITFEILIKNRVTGRQDKIIQNVHGNFGMYWKLFDNGTYIQVSCQNTKKEYCIEEYNNFNECWFEFYDGTQIFKK